ncbi:AAA family ATPase [Siminovitchia terrae]|uniref:HTH-type transcriptional regulatory protein TyrR n=1 Tax=Siminovitchia terrae TaxID=1914933 RepID=A0A429X6W2_SIMTE|nr:sigma 54-interacting transcriptional regulator [Siminovitchia terrae]RST59011.1 AAA family ATPase [Siminovitchia terrae]
MWGSRNNVNLLLLVTSKYEIKHLVGNFFSVFHRNTTNIFASDRKLTMLDWSKVFNEGPNLNLGEQILYTRNQEKILFTITKVNEKEFEYIISFTNISKCSALGENKTSLDDKSDIMMESNKMKQIFSIINKIAQVNSTVLILGESGVGKTMLAKQIHNSSPRVDHPFIAVNCASLPENLIESELFGYNHGTFTGGQKGGKRGLFEAANKGTIFLDEIAELPFSIQSKMLEILQSSTFRRVGGTENINVDIRIIAATNKNLKQMVEENKFRQDLYYRLNVVPINIPPLRERKDDIPSLVTFFLNKYNEKYSQDVRLNSKLESQLIEYDWPGNIRELENVIERIVVTNTDQIAELLDTPIQEKNNEPRVQSKEEGNILTEGLIPLKMAKKRLEKQLILRAYQMYGSTYQAAKALKVDQSTISKKLKEYNSN